VHPDIRTLNLRGNNIWSPSTRRSTESPNLGSTGCSSFQFQFHVLYFWIKYHFNLLTMIMYPSIIVLPSIMVHPFTHLSQDSPTRGQQRDYSTTVHPSARPVGGDSSTRRQQWDYSLMEHPSTHPLIGVFPTRSQGRDCSNSTSIHTPHRWDIPHSKAATRLLHNIHPSICP